MKIIYATIWFCISIALFYLLVWLTTKRPIEGNDYSWNTPSYLMATQFLVDLIVFVAMSVFAVLGIGFLKCDHDQGKD